MTLNPYQWLSSTPSIQLRITRLPDDEMGCWDPDSDVIYLDDRLSQVERRCTLVHEMVHRLHGDRTDLPPVLDRLQEEACKAQSARMLIKLDDLCDAMLWSFSEHEGEMAEQLWVDVDTLRDRMKYLTQSERAYLLDRIRSAREDVA